MARNTSQADLLLMLKAELGAELDPAVAPADDVYYVQMLNNTQKWLVNQHSYLLGKTTADVALTPGGRYYDFPETTIDIDRVDKPAFTRLTPRWRYSVDYGIMQWDYNAYDSENGARLDPILKWQLINVEDELQIEVWPLPANAQTLVLTGYQVLVPIDSDTPAVIDDVVLVFFTAAKILAKKKSPDAQAALSQAQAALASLKGSQGSRFERFNLAGKPLCGCSCRKRGMVGVTLFPNGTTDSDWSSSETFDGSENF